MPGIHKEHFTITELRTARPDVITSLGQLTAGSLFVEFSTYLDTRYVISDHTRRLALVRGPIFQVATGKLLERPAYGKGIEVVPLASYTKSTTGPSASQISFAGLAYRGLDGISNEEDEENREAAIPYETPAYSSAQDAIHAHIADSGRRGSRSVGLLVVRTQPSENTLDLMVGPDMFIDGSNDYFTCFVKQGMSVALDSDPRLA